MSASHQQEKKHSRWRDEWSLAEEVIYLNHGSFGPSPDCVLQVRREWIERIEREPMEFFVRQMTPGLEKVSDRLGEFVGTSGRNILPLDNATVGMNIVAANVQLAPGDEVLCTNEEYGADLRIWRHTCKRAGAELVVRRLPESPGSPEETAEYFLDAVSPKTRLIVVSHVASMTSRILPVESIVRSAGERGVPVCVDGPHALAMRPLNLDRLGCAFYTASCHKWLCAPFGTGFLYVSGPHQAQLEPVITSWGRNLGGFSKTWKDEFSWSGTRDQSSFLAIPAAIDFLEAYPLDEFRRRTHELARYARARISKLTGIEPLLPDGPEWYGSMVSLPLPSPPGRDEAVLADPLQEALWKQFRIEVPVLRFQQRRYLRVSCHLYNDEADIDALVDALEKLRELH